MKWKLLGGWGALKQFEKPDAATWQGSGNERANRPHQSLGQFLKMLPSCHPGHIDSVIVVVSTFRIGDPSPALAPWLPHISVATLSYPSSAQALIWLRCSQDRRHPARPFFFLLPSSNARQRLAQLDAGPSLDVHSHPGACLNARPSSRPVWDATGAILFRAPSEFILQSCPPMCDLPTGHCFGKAQVGACRCGWLPRHLPVAAPQRCVLRPAVTSAKARPDAECIVHRAAPTTHALHRVAR